MEWKARTDPELWKGLGRKGWRQGERRDIDLKSKVRGQVQPGGMDTMTFCLRQIGRAHV